MRVRKKYTKKENKRREREKGEREEDKWGRQREKEGGERDRQTDGQREREKDRERGRDKEKERDTTVQGYTGSVKKEQVYSCSNLPFSDLPCIGGHEVDIGVLYQHLCTLVMAQLHSNVEC